MALFCFIDFANRCGNEVGIVFRMLPVHQNQPLVPDALQRKSLLTDILQAQRPANGAVIAAAKRAVGAVVDTHAPDIERGKKHNPVSIDCLLEFAGRAEYLLDQVRAVGRKQNRGFRHCQRLLRKTFGENFAHPHRIRPGVFDQRSQRGIINEVARALAQFHLRPGFHG